MLAVAGTVPKLNDGKSFDVLHLRVVHAVDKWLGAILRPHAVELPRVPNGLEEKLWHCYRVGARAFVVDDVSHVALRKIAN